MAFLDWLSSDLSTVITEQDYKINIPGTMTKKRFGVKNNTLSPIADLKVCIFGGLKNGTHVNTSGTPIIDPEDISVIRMDDFDNIKKKTILPTDNKIITKNNLRPTILRYSNGNYTEITSGNIPLMENPTDIIYIGLNFPARRFRAEVETPGEYSGLEYHFYDGATWSNLTISSDGTSGYTTSGNIDIDIGGEHRRTKINNKTMLWYRLKADTITTQAILSNFYIQWLYDIPQNIVGSYSNFWSGSDPKVCQYYRWDKADEKIDMTGLVWVEFLYMGKVLFNADPLDGGDPANYEVIFAGEYKLPEKGIYSLTFSDTSTCHVVRPDATEANFSIVADGATWNEIEGMNIKFSELLQTSNAAQIPISDGFEDIWFAKDVDENNFDYGTLTNSDLNLGSINAGEIIPFWIILIPSRDKNATGNNRESIFFTYGND